MKRRSRPVRLPKIVSVELQPPDKRRLDSICHDRGMTIKALLDRLVRWFATAPETRQNRILRNEHDSEQRPRRTRGR